MWNYYLDILRDTAAQTIIGVVGTLIAGVALYIQIREHRKNNKSKSQGSQPSTVKPQTLPIVQPQPQHQSIPSTPRIKAPHISPTGSQLQLVGTFRFSEDDFVISPDKRNIFSWKNTYRWGQWSSTIYSRAIDNPKQVQKTHIKRVDVETISFHPLFEIVAIGSYGGKILMWSTDSNNLAHEA